MSKENLDEFADYLAEFEKNIFFDNEECPACGLKLDESKTLGDSVAAKYILAKEVNSAYTKLADEGISAWIKNIEGTYCLFVNSDFLEKAKNILSEN